MSTDLLYPILIGAGCLLVLVLVQLLTRPKPSKADIRLPGPSSDNDYGASPRELGEWHRVHESSVLGFIDMCDGDEGFDPDAEETAEALQALDTAIEEHPAPEMRAELATLRASAHAIAAARERDDEHATASNLALYESYRATWLDRLKQFPVDSDRIAATVERGQKQV